MHYTGWTRNHKQPSSPQSKRQNWCYLERNAGGIVITHIPGKNFFVGSYGNLAPSLFAFGMSCYRQKQHPILSSSGPRVIVCVTQATF